MEPKDKKEKSYWTVKVFFLLVLILVVFVGYSAMKVIYRKKQVQNEIKGLMEEASKLERDNNDLKDKVSYFESKDFQEKEVKDKLSLQSPDENLVVVKPGPAKEKEIKQNEDAAKNEIINETPVYKKWLDYFFKY
jgi:cell division protein FtsL